VSTTIDIRHNVHPEMAKTLDTEGLRKHFLITDLFQSDHIHMTYSHVDRLVLAGVMPVTQALVLEAPKAIGQPTFFAAREAGIINIGGAGHVVVDGTDYALQGDAALYIGRGAKEVSFRSASAVAPAQFYLVSAPAHKDLPVVLIDGSRANRLTPGAPETCNQRTIHQFLHPDVVETCQLTMGLTRLATGSVWNTMPAHTHDRRSEAYLYFDIKADQRVFHLMGEPQETRHLVVGAGEAVISPSWSIHAGAGTAAYAFIWAMAGDNKDFTDMDHIKIEDLQ